MFIQSDIAMIRSMVSEITSQPLPSDVLVAEGADLHVSLCNGRASITAADKNALARGYFLLARAAKEGKTELDVHQSRHFASCGIMVDVSRNAVMKKEAVKRVIRMLVALGMNMLMLYTEDTYEVPGYPYLGYLRGRYTLPDLRELNDYAKALDVELIPCIQTLGHMEQFLQWNENGHRRDQNDNRLPDYEKTYELITAQIAALRSCFDTDKIHIGMDEAHGVGLGRYFQLYGVEDRHTLLCRHLQRVCDICRAHSFHPMMWSDMFFRLGSKSGDYYDPQAHIPEEIIRSLPDVDLFYWDYYHMEDEFYEHQLAEHARMGRTHFAGGVWTWSGFLPHVKRTEATMRPALRACARQGMQTVLATMWGDDGAETCPFLAFNQLAIFSESCWQGSDVSDEEIALTGECLTGMDDRFLRAMGEFYPSERERCTGKGLIWCDPLYPMMNYGFETMGEAACRFRKAEAVLAEYAHTLEGQFAYLCMHIAAVKGELVDQLRSKYLAGERDYLAYVVREVIPELLIQYEKLKVTHRELWERDMKRNGWEVLCLRYGGVTARLEDVQFALQRYLSGELDTLAELDEEPLSASRLSFQHYRSFATPMARL